MVRTIQTVRNNTNYIPLPRQVPVYLVVVKEIPVDLPRIRVENGVILEDSSEEFLPTPTPLAESLAFAAGSSPSASPAPVVQAPVPGGDDPDNSGDDDEDDNPATKASDSANGVGIGRKSSEMSSKMTPFSTRMRGKSIGISSTTTG